MAARAWSPDPTHTLGYDRYALLWFLLCPGVVGCFTTLTIAIEAWGRGRSHTAFPEDPQHVLYGACVVAGVKCLGVIFYRRHDVAGLGGRMATVAGLGELGTAVLLVWIAMLIVSRDPGAGVWDTWGGVGIACTFLPSLPAGRAVFDLFAAKVPHESEREITQALHRLQLVPHE